METDDTHEFSTIRLAVDLYAKHLLGIDGLSGKLTDNSPVKVTDKLVTYCTASLNTPATEEFVKTVELFNIFGDHA